uniref:Uncharacterized protein n=1 Tax=viral metagenome TaxID=1070528 RepID=A0A6C0D1S6_9ZZZZ
MQKNNFCSFAPLPTRVIERYGDSNITCSTPTPLKVASKIPDHFAKEPGKFKIDYQCRPDTAENALQDFNAWCKKQSPNFINAVKCDNNAQMSTTVTDPVTNKKVKYYTCTGTCK